MNNKYVITIGREYGSGGRYVGKLLSEYLNIPFYDEEIVNLMVEETGLASDFVKNEKIWHHTNYLYGLNAVYSSLSINDQLSVTEFDIVRKLANKGSCVIVGICADYVLKDKENHISVFVRAPFDQRVKRAVEEYGVKENNPEKYIHKIDKSRAKYYNYTTDNKWGNVDNYDIVMNTSLGIDECAKTIAELVKIKSNNK